jgi:hypothetical protein
LVRALHEARFPADYSDLLVWSAPFIVQLHTDAVMEQIRRDDERDSSLKRGPQFFEHRRRWLSWRGRPEQGVVVKHIRSSPVVAQAIVDRPAVLREWLRPFVLDDDVLSELVDVARGTLDT